MKSSTYLSLLVFKVLLLFGSTSVSFGKSKIHNKMDLNDLRKVFQVETYDQVPDYDVVNVRLLSKREAPNEADETKMVHLRAFGQDMSLNLKPNFDFNERVKNMKVFMASTRSGRLKYSQEYIGKENSEMGKPYHDESNMAAIVVSHDSQGRLQMDGTIGNNLVIKPLPASVSDTNLNEYRDDDELFLDEDDKVNNKKLNQPRVDTSSSLRYQIPKLYNLNRRKSLSGHKSAHIVYKKKKKDDEHYSDYLELEPGVSWTNLGNSSFNFFESKHKRSKRQAPDTVWPEVLLVVDYDSYILHGANSRDVKKYFISFWNGVDLRYKLLANPSIRVSLAGMIVAKDREATPYLERNRLRQPNADAVDAAGALTDMGKYLYREDRLPTYDLAVVITKLDMCRRRYEGGRCNRGTAGFAYVGGACVVNKRLEKVNSVAIIEDSGGFSGIIVAAHEVGHLLGCVHDGSPPPSYLGGPGATRCPWEDGFIMSDLRHTERGFRWSSCSVEQFKHFLNGETATCLYNYPHENQLLPRVLPGTMLSLDEQCKRDRGTNACFKDARVCAQLFCFDSSSGYCVSYRPAAEGSPCGDGQVCKNGKCSTELENIIPDYTHVTQTISRSPLARADNVGPIVTHRNYYSRFRHRYGLLRPSTENNLNVQSSTPTLIQDLNEDCRDIVETVGGSMSCREFLELYSYRYCNHNYIKRNCCATHALLCGA